MITRALLRWTQWVIHHAVAVLVVTAALTGLAAWYAVTGFAMNSDTSRLIKQNTQWRANHDAFIQAFPQYEQNTFVVVSGDKPNQVLQVTRELTAAIEQDRQTFSGVYAPAAGDFVDRHALLLMNSQQLETTLSSLARAQPMLTAVAEDHSMRGILTLMTEALRADEALPDGFTQMTDALDMATRQALNGNESPISWRDELLGVSTTATYYQVIFVQGNKNFGEDLPNRTIIDGLNAVINDFEHPWKSRVQIRLTGQVPLEHGEIVSAMDSAQLAGGIALLALVVVLIWGVRSLRIIFATYLAMLVGLIWTAAFATFAVGQYNTISIIFLVMFIGLGVDFAVHLCLKYQESLTYMDKAAALLDTSHELGTSIMLCGVTSALGFLAFVPTDYTGLAEMGIISGGGMMIAVVISLTLIPAYFSVTNNPRPPTRLPFAAAMAGLVAKRPRVTAYSTLLLAAGLAIVASQATFDYSTLSLKDPQSQAMTTLSELQDQGIVTDYALTYLATDAATAREDKNRLLALEVVGNVKTPSDYLPTHQQDKLLALEDASFFLESIFFATPRTDEFTDADFKAALAGLKAAIDQQLAGHAPPESRDSLIRLRQHLQRLHVADAPTRERLDSLVVGPLEQEILWLKQALSTSEVTMDTLPQAMRDRLIAKDGRLVVSVTPAMDVVPVEAMRAFTTQTLTVVPDATGRPVLDLGIGDIVVRAFQTAIALAVAAIFVILLMTLRSLIDAVLVFIPLAMTALIMLSVSVLADLPLNMANVIVIPLIFGLGVDNGIHLVKRFHQSQSIEALANSSTPKAVLLSNLTTLGTFCALSFSSHQGIYSIGVLLTVALASLMVFTLICLPALLETFSSSRHRSATA